MGVEFDNTKLAHLVMNEEGSIAKVQTLLDHLINTGKYAAEIGGEIDCYYCSFLLGLTHDLGKAKICFKQKILGQNNKHVNHSSAGASYLKIRLKDLINGIKELNLETAYSYREIFFYVITAHHGLYDAIGEGQNLRGNFVSRIDDRMALDEDISAIEEEIHPFVVDELEPALAKTLGMSLNDLILQALSELQSVLEKIKKLVAENENKSIKIRERKIYEAFFTRLLLSILKTADCFDSSQWFQEEKINSLEKKDLVNIFSDYYELTEKRASYFAGHSGDNSLNIIRTQLSLLAQEHALKQSYGISQFEMPTGAGKTEAGLRYGVTNIKKFNKNRLFYVAPFLSVVEQSAKSIKNVLGEEYVLEHHSNIINDQDTESLDETELDKSLYLPKAYIVDYWDAAVVVTTMVQFYSTLFAERSANICRFCKLIDSAIILDEIQSLPVEHVYCFNLMLNFLSRIMKVNVLLCSATQPPFNHKELNFPLKFSEEQQVIPSNSKLEKPIDYSVFERSQVFPTWRDMSQDEMMELDDVVKLLYEQMEVSDSVLCILNTKAAVRSLFEKVKEKFPEIKVVYLTTNLCAAHRLDCIREMKNLLRLNRTENNNKTKLICVTTSLIEAGVDLDFDIVLRSITGADSIEQARGRCNREGFLRKGGKVFILRLKEDNTDVKGLHDIYKRGILTNVFVDKQIELGYTSLDMRLLTEDFYQKYFLEHADEMVYNIPKLGTSAVELLSTNDANVKAAISCRNQEDFTKRHKLFQAFETVAKYMKLIDQETKSIIVPYKNEDLLQQLRDAITCYDFKEVKAILKKLQRYTVSVSTWEEIDEHCSFIYREKSLLDLGVYVLQKESYDELSGINLRDAFSQAFIY